MLYKGFRRLGSMWTNETRNEENRMFSELFGVTNSFQQQLDNLVVSSGDSPAEVVQARGEYNLLYQRLDKTDSMTNLLHLGVTQQNERNDNQDKIISGLNERNDNLIKKVANIEGYASSVSSIVTTSNLFKKGNSNSWDEGMREMGNFVVDENDPDRRYKIIYSGYKGDYVGNNTYVGYAYSTDKINWTKGGKLFSRSSEDPYLITHEGKYYVYVEDKHVVPFRNIRLFTSTNFDTWKDEGVVLGVGSSWESSDVSSPTVIVENGVFYMLYEGRGSGSGGTVGLATSRDGINWNKSARNPVMTGSHSIHSRHDINWAENVVPDDIKKKGDRYYFTYHGTMRNSVEENKFKAGMAVSDNLIDWVEINNLPISTSTTSSTVMFMENDYIFVDEEGINKGVSHQASSYVSLSKDPSKSRVPLVSDQWKKMTLINNVVLDAIGEFDVSKNEIKVSYNGIYNVSCRYSVDGMSNDHRIASRVLINGKEGAVLFSSPFTTKRVVGISGSKNIYLHSGDIITFEYYTDSDDNPTAISGDITISKT